MFRFTNVTLFNKVFVRAVVVDVGACDWEIVCGIDIPLDITCTPLVVGLIIDAIALSRAACVDRFGALIDIPWTLFVRL